MVTAASGLPNHSQTFSIATTVRRLPNGCVVCPPSPAATASPPASGEASSWTANHQCHEVPMR
jgi:hypothetical protein